MHENGKICPRTNLLIKHKQIITMNEITQKQQDAVKEIEKLLKENNLRLTTIHEIVIQSTQPTQNNDKENPETVK